MGNEESYFILTHSSGTERLRSKSYLNKKVNKFWQIHTTVAGLNKH